MTYKRSKNANAAFVIIKLFYFMFESMHICKTISPEENRGFSSSIVILPDDGRPPAGVILHMGTMWIIWLS